MPVKYVSPAPVAVTEYKAAQSAPGPWPPPEEQTGKPLWMIATLAFVGVAALIGVAWFLMSGSHGSSSKDAAQQQTANPHQKEVEVVGVRIMSDPKTNGQIVKYLLVSHSGVELTDLTGKVTLWANTSHSDEDKIGTFDLHADSLTTNESKELTAPLKTERAPSDMPDWRNITADVAITSP